eukprot:CAMPEP_0170497124 /NCGR_PEP_ID=MMETSP0208-20121228/23753_1 /TAXON_ID=197538 /ORGANISM="Strombidium inclinatum, Strain S3" /LENGTH=103 /DNA_ID=CAMNT_0010773839 /DNA_START=1639 /DNA_END=1947 /DNA_ORIENTATION=-
MISYDRSGREPPALESKDGEGLIWNDPSSSLRGSLDQIAITNNQVKRDPKLIVPPLLPYRNLKKAKDPQMALSSSVARTCNYFGEYPRRSLKASKKRKPWRLC